jgi:GNAT superfamily N-acetyltransferase
MIDPLVRRAVPDDGGSLEQLEAEARAAVAVTRGGERWLATHPPIGAGWPAAIAERGVFVATVDADEAPVPVGFLVAAIRDDAERLVVIEQVYVHPDARELGFGDALVAAAADYGRDAGATIIEAETLPGDRDIKNLYERAGITARLIVVSRRLG